MVTPPISQLKTATITWYDESDGYLTTADITLDVKGIPLLTKGISGEIAEMEITLGAAEGDYVTSNGTPTVIDKHDRIEVTLIDQADKTFNHVYEVETITPEQSQGGGTQVTLECYGIEKHVQVINYFTPHYFENAFNVVKDIVTLYNDNAGDRQPQITLHDTVYDASTGRGNGAPKYTNNFYDYGLSEDTCYNRLLDVAFKLGTSVEAGGVLDFFDVGFETSGVNGLFLRFFSSGAAPEDNSGTPVTFENITLTGTDTSVGENEGGIDNPTGTNVIEWGENQSGSLPVGMSKYNSGLFQFIFRPEWDPTITYQADTKIRRTSSKHYKALRETLNDDPFTSSSDWVQIDMADEFGDTIQYSPWTDDKAAVFINNGTNPGGATQGVDAVASSSLTSDVVTSVSVSIAGTGYFGTVKGILLGGGGSGAETTVQTSSGTITGVTVVSGGSGYTSPPTVVFFDGGVDSYIGISDQTTGTAMFDSNVIIWNEQFFRTIVDAEADREADLVTLSTDHAHTPGDTSTFPNGFRVLVNPLTPAAPFNGSDVNGVVFDKAVVEFKSSDNTWVVKYKFDSTSDRSQVVVRLTKKMFEWDNSSGLWSDISTSDMANDCFHDYNSITNVEGMDPRPSETNNLKFPDVTKLGGTFNTNIKSAVEVTYQFSTIADRILDINDYMKHNACISFGYPMPYCTVQTISEGIGDLYKNDVLDAQNMHLDSKGFRGFNQGPSSEDFGPLNTLSFNIRMSILLASTSKQLNGVAGMRATIIDIKDNVVTQDFQIKFTDGFTWQSINLPLSGFQVYRAHKPRYMELNSIADLIAPKEIDVQNIFEWRNIKYVTIQWQDQYDDFGRFNPEGRLTELENTDIGNMFGATVKLAIDALHWKKPLLVVTQEATSASGNRPDFNIEADTVTKDYIMLYDQLKGDAKSELEIRQFRHKEYDFGTTGEVLFNVREGDSMFLKNSRLVSDSDNSVLFNIKLVAKRIEYAVTKPAAGVGGITRRFKGIKRFT